MIDEISRKKRSGWAKEKEIIEQLDFEVEMLYELLSELRNRNLIKWNPHNTVKISLKGKKIADLRSNLKRLNVEN